MGTPRHHYLILYDISSDKRREKVRKLLLSWGGKFQYSVFALHCTQLEIEQVRCEIVRKLEPDTTDRVAVVRLCAGCAERVVLHGDPLEPFELEIPDFHIV